MSTSPSYSVDPYDQPESMLAWNTEGWTAQNTSYPPAPGEEPPPPLPAGVVSVTVTGTYLDKDDSLPQAGNVRIRSFVSHEVDYVVLSPYDQRFDLDNGSFEAVLLTAAPGWVYEVTEAFPGGEKYEIAVSPDMADLGPVPVRSLRIDTYA